MKIGYDFRDGDLLTLEMYYNESDINDNIIRFTDGFDVIDIKINYETLKGLKGLFNQTLKKIKEIRGKNDR